MNKKVINLILISSLLFLASCSKDESIYADAVYLNGNVITVDDKTPYAEAIATKAGLIIAVGSTENISDFKGPLTRVIELNKKTIVPGFIDSHSHFAGVGTQALVANLLPAPDGPVNTIEDLQNSLRDFIKTSPIVENYNVVIGFNYDDSQLKEKRHPNRHDLDAVSTDIPIVVMHQSGHLGAYNSKALALMGITSETPDPAGGIIEREADGKTPSGVMQENAHFMIFFKMIPKFTQEDLIKLYKAGEHSYISNGFTTVQEGKTDLATLSVLPGIAANTGFDIDIISYPDLAALETSPILHSELMSREYVNGFRIGGVKLTFDGSPQGKTAWFTEPYFKPPAGQLDSYSGYPAFKDEEALKWLSLAFKNKWQVLVHTNGDAAIDQLIRLVETIQKTHDLGDHRTVMIHGQFTRKDQINKLKVLGIFPSLYPMHTFYWGDWHRDSVAGLARARNISPTGWLIKEGMPFTIHSDAPVTFPNSMRILDSAVNRVTRTAKVLGEEHKISPLDALKAITLWAAYQNFEEKSKGSIKVGKQADFVILDQNPLSIDPMEIRNIKILNTINNGKTIFTNGK
ncbi:MAG: putative amidohydrolase YtcJ [Gammaproteobacteria bacterium]|jgi:predicted amidohydrolase YtcJ